MTHFPIFVGTAFLASLFQALPQASPTPVTNPWNTSCPVPPNYTISSFTSTTGSNATVTLSTSYGRGTWICPNYPGHGDQYSGQFDMLCDNNGLTRVITDGFSWLWIQEWFWCKAVPQQHDSYNTLATTANFTDLGSILDCDIDGAVRRCKQKESTYEIPIQEFGTGGIIGFSPEDIDGNSVASCPTVNVENPIIKDVATCEHYGQGAP